MSNFWQTNISAKAACKMLMKLTEGGEGEKRMRKRKKGKNFTNFAKNRYETNLDQL